ncbi:MAG: GxxExxY protein [Chitinophagaceae bacterium]
MTDYLHKSYTYQIIGICMNVYNTLGYGFAEVVYKDAMELEFIKKEVNYIREEALQINYKGQLLKHYFFSDFTINQNIIVEVKSNKDGIIDEYISQTLNYLKASGIKLGLVVNFGKSSVEYKRLIY